MVKGIVKWFNDSKGFGFVTAEDGTDAFVHHNDIQGEGFKSLTEGENVTFEMTRGPKGPRAANVVKIKPPGFREGQKGAAEDDQADALRKIQVPEVKEHEEPTDADRADVREESVPAVEEKPGEDEREHPDTDSEQKGTAVT